ARVRVAHGEVVVAVRAFERAAMGDLDGAVHGQAGPARPAVQGRAPVAIAPLRRDHGRTSTRRRPFAARRATNSSASGAAVAGSTSYCRETASASPTTDVFPSMPSQMVAPTGLRVKMASRSPTPPRTGTMMVSSPMDLLTKPGAFRTRVAGFT